MEWSNFMISLKKDCLLQKVAHIEGINQNKKVERSDSSRNMSSGPININLPNADGKNLKSLLQAGSAQTDI